MADATPARIATDKLTAMYGKFTAVHDISLQFAANQVHALIGPSGCGKSTFLRTLNRLHEISGGGWIAGKVLLDGVNIYSDDVDVVALRNRAETTLLDVRCHDGRRADEAFADQCLRGLEFVAGRRPGADHAGAAGGDGVVQQDQGIDEFVGVLVLVAEAEQRHGLAAHVAALQARQELFPAFLRPSGRQSGQRALAGGRRAEDQRVVGKEVVDAGAADVHRRQRPLPQLLGDQLGDAPGAAGVGAEVDGDRVRHICRTSMFKVWMR